MRYASMTLLALSLLPSASFGQKTPRLTTPLDAARSMLNEYGLSGMLGNEDVQRSLELSKEQREDIQTILDRAAKQMIEAGKNNRKGLAPPPGFDSWLEYRNSLKVEYNKDVFDKLLPFQQRRLLQVGVQRRMAAMGVLGFFISHEVSTVLKISETQEDELKKKADAVVAKLEADILKLKQRALIEFLEELDASQRAEFHKLVGSIEDPKVLVFRPYVQPVSRRLVPKK